MVRFRAVYLFVLSIVPRRRGSVEASVGVVGVRHPVVRRFDEFEIHSPRCAAEDVGQPFCRSAVVRVRFVEEFDAIAVGDPFNRAFDIADLYAEMRRTNVGERRCVFARVGRVPFEEFEVGRRSTA